MLDRLRQQHQAMRQIVATFLVLFNRPQPCEPDVLADRRWELARLILQHLPLEDRHVYRPLLEAREPATVQLAERSMTELNDLYGRFQTHSERWNAAAITADWDGYRASAGTLMEGLLDRIGHEEDVLYPLAAAIGEADTARRPTDRNWAGDASLIREQIGAHGEEAVHVAVPQRRASAWQTHF